MALAVGEFMSECEVDLFVIGGGSGGVRAARIAASHGAKVLLAEEFRLGGTCVVRGCIPKKLLVYASRYRKSFDEARGFGWDSKDVPVLDWKRLIAAKDREIQRLEDLYSASQRDAGVMVINSRAVLEAPDMVRLLKDGRSVRAGNILIATGARPNLLDVPGVQHAITSNEVFDLQQLPARIMIVGAGYIALEFASLFANLGSEVTILHRRGHVLDEFDQDLSGSLMSSLIKKGVTFILNDVLALIESSKAEGCDDDPNDRRALSITTKCGRCVTVDEIVLAVGRSPNTQNLGLEAAGVQLDELGAIEVDVESKSTVSGIFAVGDVTNRVNLTPVAIREGHSLADRIFGDKQWWVDYEGIPKAVFSTPEIGSVGLTQSEALELMPIIDVYKTRFTPLKASLAGNSDQSLMKLIVEPNSNRIIGAHIFSDEAAEMVQFLAIMLRSGITKDQFDSTMAVHPTAAEELLTLKNPLRISRKN